MSRKLALWFGVLCLLTVFGLAVFAVGSISWVLGAALFLSVVGVLLVSYGIEFRRASTRTRSPRTSSPRFAATPGPRMPSP